MRNGVIRLVGAIGIMSALLSMMLGSSSYRAVAATFIAVATGDQHTCALTSGNVVQCWGRNAEGEIGDGTTTDRLRPTTVSGLSYGATFIGLGQAHSCAVLLYWTSIMCWGTNAYGQIGDGTAGVNRLTPTTVCASGSGGSCVALTGVTAVEGGDGHTCARTSAGGVKCWGLNNFGQLGNSTTTNSNNPVDVSGLTSGVSAIAIGEDYSCALTSAGGMKCWGYNSYGQLGDGTTLTRLTPVDVSGLTSGVSAIAAGASHTCAVVTTGGVKCWGYNYEGEVGDGTAVVRLTPVSVCASGYGQNCIALGSVAKVAAGGTHTCVVTTSSAVKCWGSQAFGELGNSVQSYFVVAPNPVDWTPPTWGQPQAGAIATGAAHSCAVINPSGAVECWGWNSNGQLGNGTTSDTTTWINQDSDGDGCTDGQELGPDHRFGGQRDPQNFWDFFDTPNDSRTALQNTFTLSAGAGPASLIMVNSTSGFPTPTSTIFPTLVIDSGTSSSETISYDAMTSTSFTIHARAQNGTTAVQHNSGAAVISNWRDKVINSDDQSRVIARYRSTGSTSIDPLSPPPAAPAYHTSYDRSYIGPNAWNLGPAEGQIMIDDITQINNQVGDSCQ